MSALASSIGWINVQQCFRFRADKMDIDEIAIERISVEDLRVDRSGVLIEQMASLAYRVFREPPWNDDCELVRLHLGPMKVRPRKGLLGAPRIPDSRPRPRSPAPLEEKGLPSYTQVDVPGRVPWSA